MNTKRDSRFELLRIVSILMITAFHAFGKIGYYDLSTHQYVPIKGISGFSLNLLGLSVLGSWGLTGVGCFFLMSAYFLQQRSSFSTKKALKILFQTIFWALVMLVITTVLNVRIDNKSFFKAVIEAVLSPITDSYWFVSTYLFMYLLTPFMNKIIDKLETDLYGRFVVVLTVVIPIDSTLFPGTVSSCNLLLAVYYYMLWGYLKRVDNNFIERNAKKIFLITSAIVVTGMTAAYLFGLQTMLFPKLNGRFSIFQILNAISLFYIFKNLRVKSNAIINFFSSGTLGVYLIHENWNFSYYLWNELFKFYDYIDKSFFVGYFFVAIVIVFVITTILDIIRKNLIEKTIFHFIDSLDMLFIKIDNFINS